MSIENPLIEDLDHILDHTSGLWEELRGKRIFITGGTGFFGCWLLESFVQANEKLKLDASALVLTRSRTAFRKKAPRLAAHPAVQFHEGDVKSFDFPKGPFTHVVHAATEASARLNEEDPLSMLSTITEGTRHTLEFARRCGAKKFLLASSGAVYGRQPAEVTQIPEDYSGAPDVTNPGSAYAEGKRLAELMCAIYQKNFGLETKIARCFAFVGPHLPLDAHFAVGNFIRDAMKGGPIRVNGDGTPYRSYLYASDLAIWLWHILFRGAGGRPYNVGSDEEITIAGLAEAVAATFQPEPEVRIAREPTPNKLAERYVPSVGRALCELDLRPTVGLREALSRTVNWYSRWIKST